MEQIQIEHINRLEGEFIAPGDKSISQRAVMAGAISRGKTIAANFLACDDSINAVKAFKSMGVSVRINKAAGRDLLEVEGKGSRGLKEPREELYLGNSGTTMRIICGLLSGQNFKSVLKGDKSLSSRPMKRVITPLRMMGADIRGTLKDKDEYPPLIINGTILNAIKYRMPVESAQVKSSLLFAGLYAKGRTEVVELSKTRDHTERMLALFGADISVKGMRVAVKGQKELVSPGEIFIPGDISSCAFFIIAALVIPGSKITIKEVGINPTRIFFLNILKRMGAKIKIMKRGQTAGKFEPLADLGVDSSRLKAADISADEVAYCIDELPALFVAACFARGITRVRGARELRIKETDRIHSMVTNLRKMGADICVDNKNNLIIRGPNELKGAFVESFGDHRTVMSAAIAGLRAKGKTVINDTGCVKKSFPSFIEILESLKK